MARTDGKEIDQILKSNGLKTLDEYNKSLSAAGFLSTGFEKLDNLICKNGGLPQGKISEAAGMAGVGKSMLAKYIASQPNVKALYIETEGALDPRKEYNFDLVQENVLENIWGVVNSAVEKDLYDLIVIDSVSMATTNQELDDDNDPSMNTNMSRAKILTKWIRSLTKELVGKKVAVLFINHLKQKVGVLYTDFYTPGGQAIPYAASLRMFLYSTKTSLIKKDGEIIGQKVRVKLEKNRFGEKTKEVEIKVLYKDVM